MPAFFARRGRIAFPRSLRLNNVPQRRGRRPPSLCHCTSLSRSPLFRTAARPSARTRPPWRVPRGPEYAFSPNVSAMRTVSTTPLARSSPPLRDSVSAQVGLPVRDPTCLGQPRPGRTVVALERLGGYRFGQLPGRRSKCLAATSNLYSGALHVRVRSTALAYFRSRSRFQLS